MHTANSDTSAGYRITPSDMHCRGKGYFHQLRRGYIVILLINDGITYETLHPCYRCWWCKWVVTMLFYVVTTDAPLQILKASSYSVHWHEAPWLLKISCEAHEHTYMMILVNSCILSSTSVPCASLQTAFPTFLWKCSCFQLLWKKCRRTQ